ncbi:MAG TPA: CehA/McbA family metallohydrolase [Gaiellaceae bacterium]|nr:CehA/McbA family metallohydrolase [Gaiellaceae bacterium]
MGDPFGGADGVWLRCALHAHSTESDGELAPAALAVHYFRAGYDALAITDHHVRTLAPARDRLLALPSTELDARLPDGRLAHVLGFGIAADPWPRSETRSLEETVAWIAGEGGAAYVAHPHWSGLRARDWERCEGVLGIEVYNAGCELEVGRGDAVSQWDEALQAGRRCFALATDDTHHPGFDSGFAAVLVHAAERSPEAVLAALRDGAFYSSTGPLVHALERDDDGLVVRCSAAASVGLVCDPGRGARVHAGRLAYRHGSEVLEADDDGRITAARLARPPGTSYARLEIVDARGRRAWTNPL